MLTRDVRLTDRELVVARDAMRDRRRELERRLKRSTYAGKPGMKDSILNELSTVRELEATFEHNRKACARDFSERVLKPEVEAV